MRKKKLDWNRSTYIMSCEVLFLMMKIIRPTITPVDEEDIQ